MQTVRYVRLYADANGESHLSDEEMDTEDPAQDICCNLQLASGGYET